jgi:hypothetical protein
MDAGLDGRALGWKIMQTLANELRAAEQALAARRSSSPAG